MKFDFFQKKLNLPTADKPSMACLATRFVYGEKLTAEKLSAVEAAEEFLREKNFKQFRVRVHEKIARIEIFPEDFSKLIEMREKVVENLKSLGFDCVTLDLQGFSSGSMNIGIRRDNLSINYKELKKGGFMRQKQENYFSMRLKSVGGHFTAAQLGTIQKVAENFGKGYIHLTSRQGIEIPFIHIDDVEEVKKTLAQGGVQVGVCGPQVRTITACQGNAVCSSGLIDTQKLAVEFDKRYGEQELPHKFKIGFTGCRNNCLKVEGNDIGIKGGVKANWNSENCTFCGVCQAVCPQKIITVDKNQKNISITETNCAYCGRCVKNCPSDAWQGKSGFIISFGGLYGNRIAIGKNFLPIIFDEEKLYKIVDATLKFFAGNAKVGERFRNMLDRVGWEKFQENIKDATI